MYIKIGNPRMLIYNGETNELIGEAVFELTPTAENNLLELVNHNKVPPSLQLLNAYIYPVSDQYTLPRPNEAYKRRAVLRALFTESKSGRNVLLEISIKYSQTIQNATEGNPHRFDRVVLENIEVESIRVI